MEGEKRIYGLLPLMAASHRYQAGKIRFHVVSIFNSKTTIEERLAELMIEDLHDDNSEKDVESEN